MILSSVRATGLSAIVLWSVFLFGCLAFMIPASGQQPRIPPSTGGPDSPAKLGLRLSSLLRQSPGSSGFAGTIHHRRYALPAGGVEQLQHPHANQRLFHQDGGRGHHAGDHSSRAQPHSAGNPEAGLAMGGPGLCGAGNRVCDNRGLGTESRACRRVAAREGRGPHTRLGRS